MRHFYSFSEKGFFNDEDHELNNLPKDAEEISVGEYRRLFEGQNQGKQIVKANPGFDLVDPPAADLEKVRSDALVRLDSLATECRLRFSSPDKDATYISKSFELDKWISDGRPDSPVTTDYPYICAEAGATGLSVTEVAELIESARDLWRVIDPQIEAVVRGAKVATQGATDKAQILTILDSASADLNEL
ncbi:hypothetical protein [Hahella ganghwensis]|uniref:hypothetical protein n=1 Tax=Hahella ganghwensis TaxID=286420 RepID=UPI00037BAC6B|nr:hypothetical protein [Hahella ganghwensis]